MGYNHGKAYMRMILLHLAILMIAYVLTIRVVEGRIVFPPGGEDQFPASTAEVEVQIGGVTQILELSGPTIIRRGDPLDSDRDGVPDQIPTEIVAMELTGSGGGRLIESPTQRSIGQIVRRRDGLADSFFDVFFEVEIPGLGTLRNMEPVRLQTVIKDIPPFGSVYFHVRPVPLVDPQGRIVGRLISAKHATNGPPQPPKPDSGEASSVFSCFYECKRGPFLLREFWMELTTLILANQRSKGDLTAEILFLNANQRPIARTSTVLTPEDLDEINVCETLDKGGITVPPAGLIEVVVRNAAGQPDIGAYGWIKNLTGRFKISEAEPDFTKVTGIAKTECRLVGPNVVSSGDITAKVAPTIRPVLIERTDP